MKALAVVAVVALMSCASAPLADQPELRRKVAHVKLLEASPDKPHEVIQEVSGISCARQAGASPSVDAAREELRIEAARVNADAVISIACEERGVSWKHNCWRTVVCTGDAIRFR